MPVSLVTPSTSVITSSPKSSLTSSSEAEVSSTVSCSSAATSVSVSSRMPAQIFATAVGMDDEVLAGLAPLVGVVLAGEDERLLDPRAVDRQRGLVGVLLDDREEVGEQAALGLVEVGAVDRAVLLGVGDEVDRDAVGLGGRGSRRGVGQAA